MSMLKTFLTEEQITLIKKFELYLSAKGRDNRVFTEIAKFYKFLNTKNYLYSAITSSIVLEFILSLKEEQMSNTTINKIMFRLKAFYQFLIEMENINEDIMKAFKVFEALPCEKKIKDFLTLDEFHKALSLLITNNKKTHPLKIKAIFLFLFFTGVRISEFIQLKRSYFDLESGRAIIRGRIKNHTEKIVMFKTPKKEVINAIKDYFSIEPEGENAFNISKPTLTTLIRNFNVFTPLNKNISAHSFRHSFARLCARNGVNIRATQKLLGHNCIASTAIYYDLTEDEIQDEYMKKIRGS